MRPVFSLPGLQKEAPGQGFSFIRGTMLVIWPQRANTGPTRDFIFKTIKLYLFGKKTAYRALSKI
jgi:hypothetical protein